MRNNNRTNPRLRGAQWLLVAVAAYLAPAICAAQAPREPVEAPHEQKRGKRPPRKQDPPSEPAREPVQLPANPLALIETPVVDPAHPRKVKQVQDEFADYSKGATDRTLTAAKSKKKTYFGYDFFQPAREIIEMHRAWLKQRYSVGRREAKPARKNTLRDTDRRKELESPVSGDMPSRDAEETEDSEDGQSREAVGDRPAQGDERDPSATDTRPEARRTTRDHSGDEKAKEAPATSDDTAELPTIDRKRRQRTSNIEGGAGDPVNAFEEVADPLSQLYRNVTASVPPTYQLAPGDSITVRYWSAKHELKTLTTIVDPQGSVALPQMGLVVVRGLTVTQAEQALRTQMRRYYNGIEASITLGKLRTIQVTVSGLSFQPGSYAVPAVATAYNVLYASGGPTESGTLRAIEVRRQGKLVSSLDMYKYWLAGTQADIPLQDGDLIYIPPRRSRIDVSGEVLNAACFELAPGETLNNALEYAGGVKASAVNQRVQINTLTPGAARILKDVDLNQQSAGALVLYDGDAVDVFSVRPLLTNRVTIEGAVDQPSDYALSDGMKVSELLIRARGTLNEAFLNRADLYRMNANNTTTLIPIDLEKALAHDPANDIALVRWDRIKVYTRQEVAWTGKRTITVRGAVSRPGLYSRSEAMYVSDVMMLAGGPAPNAYLDRAILLHQNGDGTFDIEYVNLAALTTSDRSARGPLVKDNDILAVYKVGEAQFEPEHTVTIRGEVVAPGPYPRGEGMHLSDLLKLSGGFKPGAGAKVVVAHARKAVGDKTGTLQTVSVLFDESRHCAAQDDTRLEDGDVVIVQGTGGFVDRVQTITVRGAVNSPGPIILSNKNMKLSDALREAGGLRSEAFPQGAELNRDYRALATTRQRTLADSIGQLNDLLNEHTYERERGKSYIETLKAAGSASHPDASPIPGAGAASPAGAAAVQISDKLARQELVSPARKLSQAQLTPVGDIAINLVEALRKPGEMDDLLLADGDVITVPEKPTTINIVGAVVHGSGVVYRPDAGLDYYITQVGGYAPDAAKDRIVVIHVGGGLLPAAKVKRIVPGDIIMVPTRVLAEKLTTHSNGIGEVFKSITNSAIMFKLASSLFGL
jgi:protein involved in polysaccharide export with SLBB domain